MFLIYYWDQSLEQAVLKWGFMVCNGRSTQMATSWSSPSLPEQQRSLGTTQRFTSPAVRDSRRPTTSSMTYSRYRSVSSTSERRPACLEISTTNPMTTFSSRAVLSPPMLMNLPAAGRSARSATPTWTNQSLAMIHRLLEKTGNVLRCS